MEANTRENEISLTSEIKNKILLEETLRHSIREELEGGDTKPPKNKYWAFFNTSLGIWLLSSVVLGSISFFYNKHQEALRNASEQKSNSIRDSVSAVEKENEHVRNKASMVTLLLPYLASKDLKQYKIATRVAIYLKAKGELPNELDSVFAELADTKDTTGLTPVDRQKAIEAEKVINTAIKLKPRVYIQIPPVDELGNDKQINNAKLAQNTIIAVGYLAPGIEHVGPKTQIPGTTELRYFRPGEKDQAKAIIAILQQAGITINPEPQKNTDTDSRPNHFELWFSR